MLLVNPSHVPAAAVPNPANVAKSEGTTMVAPRAGKTENNPPVAPPYITDCTHAAALPALRTALAHDEGNYS